MTSDTQGGQPLNHTRCADVAEHVPSFSFKYDSVRAPLRTGTHLRADIELRRQVNQHPGNIVDHLHHQVLAGQKNICHLKYVFVSFSGFLHIKPAVGVSACVCLQYLWGRWCPWMMSASEELSSGFTAMEHLICDSVSLPQASTCINRDSQHRGEKLWEFWVCVILTCKAGLGCPCTVCFSVTLASLDPPCAPQPPTSPTARTLQSRQWMSTEALRRAPAERIRLLLLKVKAIILHTHRKKCLKHLLFLRKLRAVCILKMKYPRLLLCDDFKLFTKSYGAIYWSVFHTALEREDSRQNSWWNRDGKYKSTVACCMKPLYLNEKIKTDLK